MDHYAKIKIEFTAYIKAVIQNSATDYKRKLLKSIEKEIAIADFVNPPRELLSCDDSSFLLEKGITHSNIENLFTDEKHYKAMKRLSDKEKLVLFLTIIEDRKADQVAEIMNTTKDNVWQIKSRAIKNFLTNLENEKWKGFCLMNDEKFVILLKTAVAGDDDSLSQIIKLYEKLILKNSFVNGKFDEDCKGYIESDLIVAIRKFKI